MRHVRLIVVIAASATALSYAMVASTSSNATDQDSSDPIPRVSSPGVAGSAAELLDGPHGQRAEVRRASARAQRGPPGEVPRGRPPGSPSESGGVIPEKTTVLNDDARGISNLDPALLSALRQAAADAAADGVELFVNSGWRSPGHQDQLLREAISKYGSEEEAARWVATPTTSAHVSGDAVDVGPDDAWRWLAERGASYGLCQIYGNEPWHYELRPEAVDRGCPPMYADPTHDPRM